MVRCIAGGYSKWCRVKIYEVGKAHLGIVLRIVFDPSRPLRKPPNPNLNHCVHQQWGAEEGSGRDFPILWLGSGGWSKFLITTAWRTSKFIAAMKISILTCDLLTCWELCRHHHCQQRHTLSAGKIWGANNVYRFIGNSKVYHWEQLSLLLGTVKFIIDGQNEGATVHYWEKFGASANWARLGAIERHLYILFTKPLHCAQCVFGVFYCLGKRLQMPITHSGK